MYFCAMKEDILCPKCQAIGRKPSVLGKYEEVRGRGDLFLWCKKCKKEIHIKIEGISLDR